MLQFVANGFGVVSIAFGIGPLERPDGSLARAGSSGVGSRLSGH
jgi:hypothetical protein